MENIPNCFYRISVKALILDEQKRFLLTKEDNGLRELPWGWLDFWEIPEESIKREIAEEMGIYVKEVKTKPAYFTTCKGNKWFRISNIIYEAVMDNKNLNIVPSKECIEARFFTVEEAKKEKLFSNVEIFLGQFNPNNH